MERESQSVVLTVNARLARWLQLQHNERRKNAGGPLVWQTPDILPLNAWLKKIWVESWPTKHILSDLQARKLWEQIVASDARSRDLDLLHLKAAAEQASKAYALIREHRLPVHRAAFEATEETRAFHAWMQSYQDRLAQWHALDPADVLDHVHAAMKQGTLPMPRRITLAGFEDVTPRLTDWLDLLRNRGAAVAFDPKIPETGPPALDALAAGKNIEIRPCADPREEAVQCARWVRAHHQPGSRTGIVVPDLNGYRENLLRELKAELAPESIYPWVEQELPFNLSLGTPLADEPMVRAALTVLAAAKNDALSLPFALFTGVIKSPLFHPGRKDRDAVHRLALKLSQNNFATVYLEDLESEKSLRQTLKANSKLKGLIGRWTKLIRQPGRKAPSQWALTFSEMLDAMGWPGPLASREYQVFESWREQLDHFASLDAITGNVTRTQAAALLSGLCEDHPFQAKTREQPIQVVGLLESAGMAFDALWVPGCHAEALPAPPDPNPFLPARWRKEHNLPRATVERELEFARQSLARLIASSDRIVFSHPGVEASEERRLSPLLQPLLKVPEPAPLTRSHRIRDQRIGIFTLEPFEEPAILPATDAERRRFLDPGPGGGQSVIRDQAQCPFRAFARHRLHAEPQETPELDFDHRERGSLVHAVLEHFWHETKNHTELEQLFENGEVERAIEQSISQALEDQAFRLTRQDRFRELESGRLLALLKKWLDLELARGPFAVTAQEAQRECTLAGVKLKLRIDRIDRLENGHTLFIDYKTGDVKPADWFGERPQEPQLPLYALEPPAEGIAYAQLKKGKLKFQTDLHEDAPPLGLDPIKTGKYPCAETWEERRRAWETVLTQTAERFAAGHTQVDPFKKTQTCQHCGLETLCRIGESAPAGDEEDA